MAIYYLPETYSSPYLNFALEELLLTDGSLPDNCFLFYVHKPSVIIGKNQNARQEINLPYVKRNGITVARRLSGGGAVYHDEGNLNYSFITRREPGTGIDFSVFTGPVLTALDALGIRAELSGRNDLCVQDRKFSGNAECIVGDRLLHHGTILFDTDFAAMTAALHPDEEKLLSKAVTSVRSRVINLKELLPVGFTLENLRQAILSAYEREFSSEGYELLRLSSAQKERIASRAAHFSTEEYVFGMPFPFELSKKARFPGGTLEISLCVRHSEIVSVHFGGDFFENRDIREIESRLPGTPFRRDALLSRLNELRFDTYLSRITAEDIAGLCFPE